MKKITLKNVLTIATTVLAGTIYAQDANVIALNPPGTGSEGNALFVDTADIIIDAAGLVTLSNGDWETIAPTGTVTLTDALSKSFTLSTKGAFDISQTDDATLGDIITGGGIDRASTGDLGIRNPDAVAGRGNGIDFDEGYVFGLDLASLSNTITLQITHISFSGLSGTEIATVVARTEAAPKPRLTFDTTQNGSQDVTSLNLYVTGGESKLNLVSIFNSSNDGGNFRVTGLRLKLTLTSTLGVDTLNDAFAKNFTLSSNPVTDNISIDYNSKDIQELSASVIDVNGRVLQTQRIKNTAASNKILFDASTLSAGLYFVKINSGLHSVTKKVIKK